MEIQKYINQKRDLQRFLLSFIDCEANYDDDYEELNDFLENQHIKENKNELKLFLRFILILAHNHHRKTDFFNKIGQILLDLEKSIKENFTNIELYNIFKSHKQILLLLFQNNLIELDQNVINDIIKKEDINGVKFCHFFYPEIIENVDEETKNQIKNDLSKYGSQLFINFDENRKIGENDSYICSLIRQDLVQEFISYVNRSNIPLTSQIPSSIFETNSLLIKIESTSLIEYAAFFGSIQIFKYLLLNNVSLEPTLWIYAIHGNNHELIHLLEEKEIKPSDISYENILKESIKCHHNDIADYIIVNLLTKSIDEYDIKNSFTKNVFYYSFYYQNYQFFPDEFTNKYIIFYLCIYDYLTLVELFIRTKVFDLDIIII